MSWRARHAFELEQLDGVDMVSFDDDLRIRREIDKVLAAHQVQRADR